MKIIEIESIKKRIAKDMTNILNSKEYHEKCGNLRIMEIKMSNLDLTPIKPQSNIERLFIDSIQKFSKEVFIKNASKKLNIVKQFTKFMMKF